MMPNYSDCLILIGLVGAASCWLGIVHTDRAEGAKVVPPAEHIAEPEHKARWFSTSSNDVTISSPLRSADMLHVVAGTLSCDGPALCDGQLGISGDFLQECSSSERGWVSLAFPIQYSGDEVCSIEMTHHTNSSGGDLYLLGDKDGNPDTSEILYEGCCQIKPGMLGQQTYTTDPPVAIDGTAWVVAVFRDSFSFDITYTTNLPDASGKNIGFAFGNLSGAAAAGSWMDLAEVGYGYCYCVSVQTTCESPVACCDTALCAADTNKDGIVSPPDSAAIMTRLEIDPIDEVTCSYDVNCDGVVNPLDIGFTLARLNTCREPSSCAPGGEICDPTVVGPPDNDNCSDATEVFEGTHPFDNTPATTDGPADCSDPSSGELYSGNNDVWFVFVAPGDGRVLISTCESTDFDTTLAIYSGTVCDGLPLACNDDGCGIDRGPSEIELQVTTDDKLKIRVGGWDNGDCTVSRPVGAGELTIDFVSSDSGACCLDNGDCATSPSKTCENLNGVFQGVGTTCTFDRCNQPPLNDDCHGAIAVVLSNGETISFEGNTTNATADCTGSAEVWEAFSILEAMDIVIDYCGSEMNSGAIVATGIMDSCSPGNQCGAFTIDDDGVADIVSCGEPEITLTAISPGTYYVPILGGSLGHDGPYTINISGNRTVLDCCQAHSLPGCNTLDSVPSPGVATCVCADDPYCCTTSWDSNCVKKVESLECGSCPVVPNPPYDECENALPIVCGSSAVGMAEDFTIGESDPISSCEAGAGGPFAKVASWWYAVTTNSSTTLMTIDLCTSSGDSDNDTVVTVFYSETTCAALLEKACDDDACLSPSFSPSRVTIGVDPSTTYLVLVEVYSPSEPGASYVTNVFCSP